MQSAWARTSTSSSRPAHSSQCCCRAGSSGRSRRRCSSAPGYDLEDAEAAGANRRVQADRPDATFSADAPVELTRITSRNVIGKLPARNIRTRQSATAATGTPTASAPPDAQGRTIRPGAADDALGLAAMIEIARKFASGPRPQRTLLFAAWTGEERGLLGSEYYALHPLYPPETMAANLTFDTLQFAGPVRDAVLVGKGQSELEHDLAEAARRRAATSRPKTIPSAGCSIAPTISPSPSAACRCCSIWRWPAPTTCRTAGARRASAGSMPNSPPNATTRPATPGRRAGTWKGRSRKRSYFTQSAARLANSRAWPDWNPKSEFAKVRDQSRSARPEEQHDTLLKGERGR